MKVQSKSRALVIARVIAMLVFSCDDRTKVHAFEIGPTLGMAHASISERGETRCAYARTRLFLRMAMPELPSNTEKYSQVPTLDLAFTATTIPPGLKQDHTTKARTWGVIRVLKGLLEYTIDDAESFELSPSLLGIIEPERKHHVNALSDDLEFVVEFHREVENV